MPFLGTVDATCGYGRPQTLRAFRYYRWQITNTKTYPPESNCVQASEFVFVFNGTNQQSTTSSATVTNPSGNNPVGETPNKLVDAILSTKALDLNFVTNGNITNFIFTFASAFAFNGYRWATANDSESRDPASWTLSGSQNGTTWTILHTVTNYVAISTRSTYNPTLWTYT
jgi:hypothetical protein